MIWQPGASWSASPEEIDVWRVDWVIHAPDGVSDALIDDWATGLLSRAELARAERLVVPAKSRQFARSRAALRVLLGHHLGTDPRALDFRAGDHGRPELDGVAFNLSHSGTIAVVALGAAHTMRLGIDVERVEGDRPFGRLVRRFFAPSEAEAFDRNPPAHQAADFARRWALKEAYVKALGTGLTYSSRDFALSDDPVSWEPRPLLSACARHGAAHRGWCFRNAWLDAGDDRFALALCSDHEAVARTFRFDFNDARG